jgi:hypothetical protein
MLKHCAANRRRRLSALPDVSPYIYIYDVKISDFTRSSISRLRVKLQTPVCHTEESIQLTRLGESFISITTTIIIIILRKSADVKVH